MQKWPVVKDRYKIETKI